MQINLDFYTERDGERRVQRTLDLLGDHIAATGAIDSTTVSGSGSSLTVEWTDASNTVQCETFSWAAHIERWTLEESSLNAIPS